MSLEISKSEMPISAEGFNTQHRRVEKFLCKFLIQPPVFYGRFAHYFFLSDMLEVFKYSAATDLVRYITSTQLTQNKSSENRNIGLESDFHFILRWNYLLMFHQSNPKKNCRRYEKNSTNKVERKLYVSVCGRLSVMLLGHISLTESAGAHLNLLWRPSVMWSEVKWNNKLVHTCSDQTAQSWDTELIE